MAGDTPGRALGTRHGAGHKQTQAILQQPRCNCANCGTTLYIREFRYCRPCRGYLALWRALVEMSRIAGGAS